MQTATLEIEETHRQREGGGGEGCSDLARARMHHK